ncbi:MAG: hypothetical protein OWS74_06280, partial [Firmicutes bacterium]|nr:hypothetical protein [Bacillota bacterium]
MEWTYSRQIKAEITRPRTLSRPCLWAEAWGLAERLQRTEGSSEWVVTTRASTARWAYRILKMLDLNPVLQLERAPRRIRYRVKTAEMPAWTVFQAVSACPVSFLHGIFLLHGYIAEPDRASLLELEGLSKE